MHYSLFAIICLTTAIAACGCSHDTGSPIAVGGLYTLKDQKGAWRVMKVLAFDEFAVHLRSYANRFPEQPKNVDSATLTLGGLHDPAGMGVGHMPVEKEGFLKENPVLIKLEPVKEEELEGYKYYLEAMKNRR